MSIYGELCRYPLYFFRHTAIIKYWCKLFNSYNIIIRTLYNDLVEYCNNEKPNWATSVKQLLYTNGFSDVWFNPCSVDINNVSKVFKQRQRPIYTDLAYCFK